jgi:hypothetical protein
LHRGGGHADLRWMTRSATSNGHAPFAASALCLGFVTLAGGAHALESQPVSARSGNETLFACKTVKRAVTMPTAEPGTHRHVGGIRVTADMPGNIALALDSLTGTMTLFIANEGKTPAAFPLSDVQQSSSPPSGASGKSDTIVRGKSGHATLTLFVRYSPVEAPFAAIRVDNVWSFLLTCGPKGYSAPTVKGGSHTITNIFGLRYDGLAAALTDEPQWPDQTPP